ncbi:MAG: formate/nitrite transporter family protein [Clostridia bacterium]|nr:formate/nitrite transporter family protein [Clostridia bacterium]
MYSPHEIYQNYVTVAKNKTEAAWYKTLILAVFAGAFIAFGAAASTAASASFSGSAASLIKAAVFPIGLMLVIICGAELFTGNCLLVGPAVGKDIKITALLKNLGIVYGGNLIGGVLIAIIVVYGGTQTGAVKDACITAATNKCNMNFGIALLRGIPCNMLVCLAVWAAMSSKSTAGKILALYMPIFAFVACGFEHSVANMYYLTAGLLSGSAEGLNVGNAILNCLIPTTLGNIVGGAVIALSMHFLYRNRKTDQ